MATDVDLGPGGYDDYHDFDYDPDYAYEFDMGKCEADNLDRCPSKGKDVELHPETGLCRDCYEDKMEYEDFLRDHAVGRV